MVGVVVAGKRVGDDVGDDVGGDVGWEGGGDVVVFVKRYGTNPDVGDGDAVGVSIGIVGLSVGSVDEYFALHIQYFLGGLVGAGKSGPSVGLLGGANVMRTGVLKGCSTSVVSVTGFSPSLEKIPVTLTGFSPSVVLLTGCVVIR